MEYKQVKILKELHSFYKNLVKEHNKKNPLNRTGLNEYINRILYEYKNKLETEGNNAEIQKQDNKN